MRPLPLGVGLVPALLCVLPAQAAKPAPSQPAVDAAHLPPGQFAGTLVSVPNSDRVFTLAITYPEVQLRPGAKVPAGAGAMAAGPGKVAAGVGAMPHVQVIHQQLHHALHHQQQLAGSTKPHHAVHHMMNLQQAVLQVQAGQQHLAMQEARLAQQMQQQVARAQQKLLQQELKAIQQQIKAIQKMYRVVQVTRNFDFQSEEGVKVRTAEPPRALDDKGAVKKYTPEELRVLKGKDRSLPGYESSVAALGVGQTVQVTLTAHKKPAASEKDKDKDPDRDPVAERKMQVRMIVIVADAPAGAAQPKKKKKN